MTKSIPSIYFRSPEADIDNLYYDAMELLNGNRNHAKRAEALLMRALKLDPHYVQTHIGFAHVYGALKDKQKAHAHMETAYNETIKKFPKWPRRMLWGEIENRAYMRAIQYKADLFADNGEKEAAIELYRLLLKLNPSDNQGVRYTLAGVCAGISGKEVNDLFDEGNEKQNWDELEKLVQKQNALHHFWDGPNWTKPRAKKSD